jgi:hypothetical protein
MESAGLMSTTIPPLKLFPLYRGGPVRETSFGAASAFRTQATEFSPSYQVNIPSGNNPFQDGRVLSLNGDGELIKSTLKTDGLFNSNLAVDATPGRLQETGLPATPPEVPSSYEDIVSQYAITDSRFSELMAQPEFSIPRIGPGLLVTTDGQGGIADVTIQPDAVGLTSAAGQDLPNRAVITSGALFKVDPTIPGSSTRGAPPAKTVKPPSAPLPVTLSPNLFKTSANLSLPGLKPGNPLEKPGSGPTEPNPILARLAQLSPPGSGLAIAGIDSQVNADQARRLAAVQAGFDVPLSPVFRRNAAELANQARFQENYAALHRIPNTERLLDGRMPVVPALPEPPTRNNPNAWNIGSSLTETGDVLDAGSRRMSGGYLAGRFSWQPGAGGMESGMGGFGQGHPGHENGTRQAGAFLSGFGTGTGQQQDGSPFAFRRPTRTFVA